MLVFTVRSDVTLQSRVGIGHAVGKKDLIIFVLKLILKTQFAVAIALDFLVDEIEPQRLQIECYIITTLHPFRSRLGVTFSRINERSHALLV